MIKAVGR